MGEDPGKNASQSASGRPSPREFGRAWLRAIRWPKLALASAVGSAYAAAELVRLVVGSIEETSMVVSLLLVFGTPTLIATLPQQTVLWRVGAIAVGLHVGPIVYAPLTELSLAAFFDSWAAAMGGDGILHIFLWSLIALPVMETIGALVQRNALGADPTG